MKNTTEKVTKLLIGEKVRQLRNARAWSQERLAEKATIDTRTIQRVEKGKGASDDTLLRVAEAFGISVTEFTMLNLSNGGFTQMSPQELSGLTGALHELFNNDKIIRKEYNEMLERVEIAGKEKAANEPMFSLEKLDFLSVVKRVLSETKTENGSDFQPYISDFRAFRIGFFRMGIPPHSTLFLAISRRESSEGLVVRLSPTRAFRDWCQGSLPEVKAPFLDLFYRSRNNDSQMLHINLEWFHFEAGYLSIDSIFDGVLQATINGTPNFELTDSWFKNSYDMRPEIYDSGSYFFKRLIKIDKMNPIEIPWTIRSTFSSIVLQYSHPVPTIWHRDRHMMSLEIVLPVSVEEKSRIAVSWPRFGKLQLIYFKLRSLFYIDKTQFLPAEDFDLVAYLDDKRPPHSAFRNFGEALYTR